MKSLLENRYFLYFILFLYVILLGIGLSHHEFWMDESHHWLIARESISLTDLVDNYRYDGHPILWVSCLWIIGQFTSKIIFVQIFHAIISSSIAFLMLFKSPFKKGHSILFIFSYYTLFEYGLLSRNYAITILFMLLFCISFKKNERLLLPFFFLGLVSNAHLFGMILSTILYLKILYDKRHELKRHIVPIVLFILMASFAFITIKAPSDHFFYLETSKLFDVQKLKSILSVWWKAIVPIPDLLEVHFWNTNFFTSNFKKISILLVLISWIAPLFVLKRKSNYYLVFYLYAFSIVLFCLLTGLNPSQRMGGFLLFSLVVISWIEKELINTKKTILAVNQRVKSIFLYGFLGIQVMVAMLFITTDVIRPFSNTKNLHHFLIKNIGNETPVYGGLYCNYIGINNYGELKMHIVSQDDTVKYCDWRGLTKNKAKVYLEEGLKLMDSKGYKKMVFLSQNLLLEDIPQHNVKFLAQVSEAMVKNENAYVYLVSKK